MKQSPNPLRQCVFGLQTRFVTLRAARVYWSHSGECTSAGIPSNVQGFVDLVVNECEVVEEDDFAFVLRPSGGSWIDGAFTGHEHGRVFQFDAGQSERSKSEWLDVFHKHINYASVVRASLRADGQVPAAKGNVAKRSYASSDGGSSKEDKQVRFVADAGTPQDNKVQGLVVPEHDVRSRTPTPFPPKTEDTDLSAVKFSSAPDDVSDAATVLDHVDTKSIRGRLQTPFVPKDQSGEDSGAVKFAEGAEVVEAASQAAPDTQAKPCRSRLGTAFAHGVGAADNAVMFAKEEAEVLEAASAAAAPGTAKPPRQRMGTAYVHDNGVQYVVSAGEGEKTEQDPTDVALTFSDGKMVTTWSTDDSPGKSQAAVPASGGS